MKRNFLATTAVAVLALCAAVPADAQNWLVRGRAIGVLPDASSSLSGLDVDDAYTVELDLSYFFTKNIAVEVIAATARHEVTLNGTSLGKVSVLPPTVTLQYHFTDLGAWKPYVGGGLNYTWFYDVGLQSPLDISRNSWGGALQAGVDYAIDKNWLINVDVKYIWISTDVSAAGSKLTTLDINPWVVGLGVGYRF
ncbi:MAG: OmpW family outer membrane protein [Burkholderiales bacterium]